MVCFCGAESVKNAYSPNPASFLHTWMFLRQGIHLAAMVCPCFYICHTMEARKQPILSMLVAFLNNIGQYLLSGNVTSNLV